MIEGHYGSGTEYIAVMQRNCHYFLPVGQVELDETEYVHLRFSVTEILKCGCSLWVCYC